MNNEYEQEKKRLLDNIKTSRRMKSTILQFDKADPIESLSEIEHLRYLAYLRLDKIKDN